MFRFLDRFKRRSPGRVYRVPAGRRVYVVGDIHGRADLLADMHERIIMDAADVSAVPGTENMVVYLGDYVDRGTQVRKTLDMLIAGLGEDFQVVHLRGNHEEIMLRFLDDPATLETWLGLGGQATLMNYRVSVPGSGFSLERAAEVRDDLERLLPPPHLRFLQSLRTSFALGDYLFVHAGIRPDVPLSRQSPEDLLWIREDFLASNTPHEAMVVHGHSIARRPELLFNRIGLDTGAYATGVLSCAVLEDDRVRLLGNT